MIFIVLTLLFFAIAGALVYKPSKKVVLISGITVILSMKDKNYYIHIYRTLHEGESRLLVKISQNKKGNYNAEILEEKFVD